MQNIEIFFQFVGYVFGFWFVWKIYDTVLHKATKKKTGCPYCDKHNKELEKTHTRYEKELKETRKINDDLSRRNALLVEEIEEKKKLLQPKNHSCDFRLLQQLNVASPANLEKIYGVGPKKAKVIVQKRPFVNMQEVREILPDWLIDEARKWSTWVIPDRSENQSGPR